MSEIRLAFNSQPLGEALSSKDTLSLLVPRIRAAVSSLKDKRKQKQVEELIQTLEDLQHVLEFAEGQVNAAGTSEEHPFVEGLPRCNFQIESQFEHYVNPPSSWRESWTKQRLTLWEVFEKTIPWTVRELLMSWRWRGENEAFRKILETLKKSRDLVGEVEQKLLLEEKRSFHGSRGVTWNDRLRILLWSRDARKDESVLFSLEQARDELLSKISERLQECERTAALTAAGIKTLFVDCGEFYPRVFEGCCRAMDKEIGAQLENEFRAVEKKNLELALECEEKANTTQHDLKKVGDYQQRILQAVEGRLDLKIFEAERILSQEFMCLNAIELEKQDLARGRWQRAVAQMKRVLQTAEENFSHGEIDSRDAADDGVGRSSTSQIRI